MTGRTGGWPHDFPSDLFWASQEPMTREDADEAALRILTAAGLRPMDARGLRVLDVGCGRGEVAIAFAELGALVTGIDYDADRIAEARTHADAARAVVRLLIADATNDLPGGPYDLAFCHYTGWGYGGISRLKDTFASVRAALSPTGVFVAETHDADRLIEVFRPELSYPRRFGNVEWQVNCHGVLSRTSDRGAVARIDQAWSYTTPHGTVHGPRLATFETITRSVLDGIAQSTGYGTPAELDAAELARSTPGGNRLLLRFEQIPMAPASRIAQRMHDAWSMIGDGPAVQDAPGTLTGRDMLDVSTRLELAVRRLGHVANRPVAVLVPRGWAWPATLLACRSAGAVFAPIDPDQPDMRIRAIVDALRPAAVVCLDADRSRMSSICDMGHGAFDVLAPGPVFESLAVLIQRSARTLPEAVSHVFHTSGSTGRPKAVMLGEEGLLMVVDAQRELLPKAPGTSLWTLGPGFDASLSDVLCPILSGRVLRTHRPKASRLRELKEALAGVQVADLPPSMLAMLREETQALQGIVFGGERAPADEVARLASLPYGFQAYGPTEASVCCMTAAPAEDWAPGILGRPLIPSSIALLHEGRLHGVEASPASPNAIRILPPLPKGATAEIVVVGDLVACGYVDSPDQEAERFGLIDGARVHFTGDLARQDGDVLVWTGRKDRQTKINGRMVCPEEIELAVTSILPDARSRVVIHDGRIRLFVTGTVPPADLAALVSARLGPTFRPASVHHVHTMPVGTTGKPDDAALLESIR